jgi:hypothetical protein
VTMPRSLPSSTTSTQPVFSAITGVGEVETSCPGAAGTTQSRLPRTRARASSRLAWSGRHGGSGRIASLGSSLVQGICSDSTPWMPETP